MSVDDIGAKWARFVVAFGVLVVAAACGPSATQVAAVRKQIDAKRSLANSELERLSQDTTEALKKLFAQPTPDLLVAGMNRLKASTDLATRRCTSVLDDLDGFIAQNADYEQALDFSAVRASCGEQRRRAGDLKERISSMASSVRDVTVEVESGSGEWVPVDLPLAKGDILVFSAPGTWTVGSWAGSCGAGGMRGYEKYSLDGNYPHGALLIRCGHDVLAGGAASGALVIENSGSLLMRCNDKKATDNGGKLSVRLVLAPMSPAKSD